MSSIATLAHQGLQIPSSIFRHLFLLGPDEEEAELAAEDDPDDELLLLELDMTTETLHGPAATKFGNKLAATLRNVQYSPHPNAA